MLIKNMNMWKSKQKPQYYVQLHKHLQTLYAENYKILMTEMKYDLINERHTMFTYLRTQQNKDVNYLQIIYRLNTIPPKILPESFVVVGM